MVVDLMKSNFKILFWCEIFEVENLIFFSPRGLVIVVNVLISLNVVGIKSLIICVYKKKKNRDNSLWRSNL